ncbi:Imm50 family immunity protein [Streptomyces sp. G7(2002)]|uniref:Imm50 family immunity protein n=1 Tax=Streptomyces sp. G7(2002) TaxID=2971798 RepID=UPI00237EBE17|nr:Imm50 family immunity protein [Streptomyces sp. G7(2002)]WDT55655.1 immunity 50 family protein [Streptomyces sp. G7(2002)]
MTASNWRRLLEDSGGIERFYEFGPELSSCNLIYLHMDERGQSLTMCLEADEPFTPPREDGNPTVYNVVEFHLTFLGVKNLEFDGWQNYANKRTEVLKYHPDGAIHVSITGHDEFVKFTAGSASIIHSQAKRKAAE